MKKRLLLFVLMIFGFVSYAQQDAQFSHYMYNTININPAYAGSRGVMSLFGLYRTQWVGLEGAPKTATVSMNTPLSNSNLGVGVSFINDRIGPASENGISADLSYSIRVSSGGKLSFGVKGTANLFDLDASKLRVSQAGDATLQSINSFSPNVGAGLYWHGQRGYLGFSVPNFIETVRYNEDKVELVKDRMNYYLIGGLVFNLSDNTKFKPAFLTKMVQGAPLQVDLSGNFLFFDKFMLGASYRWSAALSAMVGFQVSDGLYLGYGYDRETTSLANFNSGSHEIFLRYELFKNNDKITTPRFF